MYAEAGEPPGTVLTKVTHLLKADLPNAKFITMIYSVLNPARRSFTFANAGHHPPILTGSGGVRALKTSPTLPLGVMKENYPNHEVNLAAGDRLFLYSDGVVEARNSAREEYGEERLVSHAAIPTATPKSLLRDVEAHVNGYPAMDDITAVMLEAY